MLEMTGISRHVSLGHPRLFEFGLRLLQDIFAKVAADGRAVVFKEGRRFFVQTGVMRTLVKSQTRQF